PTGHAGLRRKACIIVGNSVLEACNQFRTFRTRTDQTHFALKDVPELRDFVQVPLAKERTDPQPSIIIRTSPLRSTTFRIGTHAAQFDDLEITAIAAGPQLPVKNGPGRFQVDQDSGDANKWR